MADGACSSPIIGVTIGSEQSLQWVSHAGLGMPLVFALIMNFNKPGHLASNTLIYNSV